MDLNNIKIALRPRIHWAAADLGMIMVKRWWKPLFYGWLVITLPIFAFCMTMTSVFASTEYLWILVVVFWWLKPVWERIHLHVLSHAVFGETPSIKEIVKGFPRLALNQVFLSLTLRRFSPYRSFDLPIIQLENLSGLKRQARIRILHNDRHATTVWVMFTCLYLEIILVIALIGLVLAFIPDVVDFDPIAVWQSNQSALILLIVVLCYLSMTLIAPIYAACGFSCYLNRRTILEGWDLELGFRKLNDRFSAASTSKKGVQAAVKNALLVFIAVAGLLGGADLKTVYAQSSQKAETSNSKSPSIKSKERIKQILDGKEFHRIQTNRTFKFRYDWPDKSQTESKSRDWSWLKPLFLIITSGFEYVFWIILITLAIILIYTYRREIRNIRLGFGGLSFRRTVRPYYEENQPPTFAAAANIPEKALQLWRQGKSREALGLLYRVAIALLVKDFSMELQDSYTEEECVRLVNKYQPEQFSHFFKELTITWQNLAYGHRTPDTEVFSEICLKWTNVFSSNEPIS